MTRKRLTAILVVAILAVASVTYLNVVRTGRPRTEVRIGMFSKAFSYAPLFVAKHFRWFEEHPDLKGRTVTFTVFDDRPTISASLSADELELLFCAEIPAIVCRAQGDDICILKLSDTAAQRVLVRTDLPIQVPADLRGKRVAVLQATSSHYGLLKILRDAGMTEKDVDIQYMTAPEARAAFESKQLAAWAVWAPFVEVQEINGNGREIGGEGAWIHSIMAAPVSRLRDDRAVIKAAVAIIERGKQFIGQQPETDQDIVAKEMGLPIEVVRKAWPKFTWDAQLTDGIVDDFQRKADFLAELDKTRQSRRVDVRKELMKSL
jgi:ABC-type nitrate/sulfonate/bicarbonate transport system substrate-binding protein